MILSSNMAHRLAELAVSRARLRHALSTAAGCGDYQWCRENRPRFDSLNRRIESLVKVLRYEVVKEARDLTNADI